MCSKYFSIKLEFTFLKLLISISLSKFSTEAFISINPEFSPIGNAPVLHNFKPLYSFGLWEAVIMRPGLLRRPDKEYTISVGTIPI